MKERACGVLEALKTNLDSPSLRGDCGACKICKTIPLKLRSSQYAGTRQFAQPLAEAVKAKIAETPLGPGNWRVLLAEARKYCKTQYSGSGLT